MICTMEAGTLRMFVSWKSFICSLRLGYNILLAT